MERRGSRSNPTSERGHRSRGRLRTLAALGAGVASAALGLAATVVFLVAAYDVRLVPRGVLETVVLNVRRHDRFGQYLQSEAIKRPVVSLASMGLLSGGMALGGLGMVVAKSRRRPASRTARLAVGTSAVGLAAGGIVFALAWAHLCLQLGAGG
jgi:hypothetical protein